MGMPISWILPVLVQPLGWTLLHFVWQGALIALAAAVLMALNTRPAVRYAIGVSGLAAMLAAPVVTFAIVSRAPALAFFPPTRVAQGVITPPPHFLATPYLSWLVAAWLCGVMLLAARALGGVLLVNRQFRHPFDAPGEPLRKMCLDLQQYLGVARKVQYRLCPWLETPAVMGWLRPVLFLPAAALTRLSPDQFKAVVAHELAHIRRHDAWANLFQVVIETLLFYHPAVWWLSRRVRAERELCCDAVALSVCDSPRDYARALTIMEEWRAAPVFSLAANGGVLTERVMFVLGTSQADARWPLFGLAGALLLLSVLLASGNWQPRTAPQVLASLPVPVTLRAVHEASSLAVLPRPFSVRPVVRRARNKPTQAVVETVSPRPVQLTRAPVWDGLIVFLSAAPALPSQAAPEEAASATVCRSPQQLPGSRFFAPKVCLGREQWTRLAAQGYEIAPDGRQLVQADAYVRNRERRPTDCLMVNSGGSSNQPSGVLPSCF
jgi:beta-lactamase regulating signal transducer with metallopeptidase domain